MDANTIQFRHLTPQEEQEFRQGAREDYKVGTKISNLWHPVYRAECDRMNNKTQNQEGLAMLAELIEYAIDRANVVPQPHSWDVDNVEQYQAAYDRLWPQIEKLINQVK